MDSAFVLSPHESLQDRIEALKGLDDRNTTARLILQDDSHPFALREEALLLLDGSQLFQDDLRLALSCCVPVCPFHITAISTVQRFTSSSSSSEFDWNAFLVDLENSLLADPRRHLLFSLWGMFCFLAQDSSRRRQLPLSLVLVDFLSELAGDVYLSVSSKSELMGSYKPQALAALLLREFAPFATPNWVQLALKHYPRFPHRAHAISNVLSSGCMNANLVVLLICQAVEEELLPHNNETNGMEKWNHVLFWKTTQYSEEELVFYRVCQHFGSETKHLLECGRRPLQSLEVDPDVQLRFALLLSCFATLEFGISFPWKVSETAQVATELLQTIQPTSAVDLEEFSKRLVKKESESDDWVAKSGFLYLLSTPCEFLGNNNVPHLLYLCLLPLLDDVDPRLNVPAWKALKSNLDLFPIQLLVPTIERALSTREFDTLQQILGCVDHMLDSFPLLSLMDRLSRDAFYAAHSHALLYPLLTSSLAGMVEKCGLGSISLLNPLLVAVEAGITRNTFSHAHMLLVSILHACGPRIKAHKERIFVLYLRLAVFQNVVHLSAFRLVLPQDEWLEMQIQRVAKVNAPMAHKLIFTL